MYIPNEVICQIDSLLTQHGTDFKAGVDKSEPGFPTGV